MQVFDGPVEGKAAILAYLRSREAATPEYVRDCLWVLQDEASPVETTVEAAELIYARRSTLPADLLDIGAGLAIMCQAHGFSNGLAGRAAKMALVMRNDASEALPPEMIVAEADYPTPEARYVETVEETPPAPV